MSTDGLSSAEKRLLLKRLLTKTCAPTLKASISHDPAGRFLPFPLSPIQQAYVLGRSSAFAWGGTSCHLYVETTVPAAQLAGLEQAWNRLLQAHDALRMLVDAAGQQRVLPSVPTYRFDCQDLRAHDAAAAEAAVLAVREQMCTQLLPLSTWPLFCIKASLMPDGYARLHIDLDLLLSDAAGMMRLLKDWSDLAQNPTAPYKAPTLVFRDLVLAEPPPLEADLAYWRARLPKLFPAPELPLAAVPTDRPRFTRYESRLDAACWAALRKQAQARGLTSTALLLGAYAEALGRFCTNRRFTLILTRFHRPTEPPEAALVIGEATTTLLLAVDLRAESFGERIRAIGQALDEALAHGSVNAVSLLRETRAGQKDEGGLYFPCVFTSLVGLHRGESLLADIEAGLGRRVFSVSATPQVLVDHQVFEDDGCLHSFWDIRDGALAMGVAESLVAGWEAQLRELAQAQAAWERPRFRRLTDEDCALRERSNATASPPPAGLLHTPWLKAAARHKDRPAIISPKRSLSHAELEKESRRVAAALLAHGVGVGDRVIVHLPRGFEQAVAVFGILRAGAAYLPIDGSLPALRVIELAERSGAVACLTTLPPPAGWPTSIPRLLFGELPEAVDFVDRTDVDPQSLAYVIFTSGSTGVPKGVMISHQSALNTVLSINQRFGVGPNDRVLGVSALGFDLSVWDLFGVLGAGGAVVLPASSQDPACWADACVTSGVTLWNSVPALAEMLVEYAEGTWGLPSGLRLFLLSGDWVPVDLPGRLRAAGTPGVRIISLGGATEASIWSIAWEIAEVDPGWKSIPYGFPLKNQRFRVVDECEEDCPLGVAGELLIGGLGVAMGYLGDSARTAERFFSDPQGTRWYRTGDFGRYRADGSLEFLGRRDDQVKVRGHRIELAEVEAALLRHSQVAMAIAYAPFSGTGHGRHRQLLAAVVQRPLRPPPDEPPPPEWAAVDEAIKGFSPDASMAAMAMALRPELTRMETESAVFTALALQKLGFLGEQEAVPERAIDAGILPSFLPWVRRALAALTSAGLAVQTSGGWRRLALPPLPTCSLTGDPRLDRARETFHRAGRLLLEVLTGARPAADLLFPEGTTETAEHLYGPWFAGANAVLSAVLSRYLGALPKSAPVRVLEIGAGVGSTTRYLLPLLPPDRTTYVYTDISPWFFERARAQFADFPFLHFAPLDAERAPAPGELPLFTYDLVVASSVVHATRDVVQTLANLRNLLRPGGLLLMVEETVWHNSFNLTMGLQTGFDRAEDGRTPHPLLAPAAWLAALQEAGFSASKVILPQNTVSGLLGIAAIVAAASTAEPLHEIGLRTWLGEHLPSFMIPARIYRLAALPLSPNGKVDRRALPVPAKTQASGPRVAPAAGAETLVAEIWEKVLHRKDISATDHFFELGGDSLLVVAVQRALTEALGRTISVTALFEHATIKSLAHFLESSAQTAVSQPQDPSQNARARAAAEARRRRDGK